MKIMLDEGAYMPVRAHETDAGYDLRTPKRVVLHKNSSVVIDTGVHICIDKGICGLLESKSGLNINYSVVSHGGLIDSKYTGSIVAKLYNHDPVDYVFEKGDKIVQIIFLQHLTPDLEITDRFEETERGDNGFGSTGR